ncbi:META domain-containing protein [Rufibacter glacialis]|nr:META domain-containing protein [Rufibacter glacialis]
MNSKLAAIAVSLLLLSSCAPNATPTTSTTTASVQTNDTKLLNGSWRLISLNGKAVSSADVSRTPQLTFQVAEQRVNGFTGCNRVFGGATATATHLTFQHLGSTRMACAEENLEQPFLAALSDTTLAYQVTSTQLTLLKENQPVLVFTRTKAE